MKKLLLAILLLPIFAKAQTTYVTQTVTASATINSTARIVLVTSGSSITLTMPSSPPTGRVITIVNHSTGDVTFSGAIRVSNSKTSTLLSAYPNEFLSGISTNKITIFYDGSQWRLID